MSGAGWIADVNAAMAGFVAERPIVGCAVRIKITFGDGLSVMAKAMGPDRHPGRF